MKVVELQQGSPEWLEWRRSGIGASESAAVLAKSPYMTPRQLGEEKIFGKSVLDDDPSKDFIFNKGHKIEALIRKEYFDLTGVEMKPLCAEDSKNPIFKASFDGFHEKRGVLEGKYVGKKAIEAIEAAKRRPWEAIPIWHMIQMQQQIMVADDEKGDYFCHDGKKAGLHCPRSP